MNYWQKQDSNKPLFEAIFWSKPEQRSQLGRLGIIGGTKTSFLAVAKAHQTVNELGPEPTLVLPEDLKPILKSLPNTVFAVTNPSGGLSQKALADFLALQAATDGLLLVGDAGKNSETNLLYENFALQLASSKPVVITRDAIELVSNSFHHLVNQPNLTFIMSFAQAQKLFRGVYYPVMLLHSMPLVKLIEALHKFTITYPPVIVLFHQNQLLIAQAGRVISVNFDQSAKIWQGILQAKIACWQIWNPQKLLEATVCALVEA